MYNSPTATFHWKLWFTSHSFFIWGFFLGRDQHQLLLQLGGFLPEQGGAHPLLSKYLFGLLQAVAIQLASVSDLELALVLLRGALVALRNVTSKWLRHFEYARAMGALMDGFVLTLCQWRSTLRPGSLGLERFVLAQLNNLDLAYPGGLGLGRCVSAQAGNGWRVLEILWFWLEFNQGRAAGGVFVGAECHIVWFKTWFLLIGYQVHRIQIWALGKGRLVACQLSPYKLLVLGGLTAWHRFMGWDVFGGCSLGSCSCSKISCYVVIILIQYSVSCQIR